MCPKCQRSLAYPVSQCKGGCCPFCGYKSGQRTFIPEPKPTYETHKRTKNDVPEEKTQAPEEKPQGTEESTWGGVFETAVNVAKIALALGAVVLLSVLESTSKRK